MRHQMVCFRCAYTSTDPAVIEEARQYYISQGEHEQFLYVDGAYVIYDLCGGCQRWDEEHREEREQQDKALREQGREYYRQNPDAVPPF